MMLFNKLVFLTVLAAGFAIDEDYADFWKNLQLNTPIIRNWDRLNFLKVNQQSKNAIKEENNIEVIQEDSEDEDSNNSNTSDLKTEDTDKCPSDQSLFSKNDINVIIENIIEDEQVYEKLYDSYHLAAIHLNEKHTNDLNEFLDYIKNRPKYLVEILKSLSSERPDLEEEAAIADVTLNQLSNFEHQYEIQERKVNRSLDILHKTKQICDLCSYEDYHVNTRSSTDRKPDNHCSTLIELTNYIRGNLNSFIQEQITENQKKFFNEDEFLKNSTEIFKDAVKKFALNAFGLTMYDVLILEHGYNNFRKLITGKDWQSYVDIIQMYLLENDVKISTVNAALKRYKTYCANCGSSNNKKVKVFSSLNLLNTKRNSQHGYSHELVDYLLQQKQNEILEKINSDFKNIFSKLKQQLNDTKPNDIYVEDLKPIQDDIKGYLETEKEALKRLKDLVPETSFQNIQELLSKLAKSEHVLENILDEIYDV